MSKIDELLKNEKVEWKRLGDIGEFYGGLTGKKKNDFIDGNAKFISYKNVYKNPATKLDVVDMVKIHNDEKQHKLKYGDILFTGSSETPDECGMSSVINQVLSENIYLNSFCFFLRLSNENLLLPDFSKHLFRSENIRIQIGKTASGVTRFNVSKELMKKIEIPIPSLKTQEKIVKILDSFTNYVAELQTELQARTKQYSYYRDMLLSEKYLNKISEKIDKPENNSYKVIFTTLGEIADIVVGGDVPKENFSALPTDKYKIPIYSNGIAEKALYGYTNIAKVKEKSVTISARGTIGHVSYREKPYYPIVRLICLLPNKEIKARYLYYSLQNTKINHVQTGIPSLTTDMVKNIKIILPPIEIQNKVVQILDKFQALIEDTKGLLPQEIEQRKKQYEYYREALLTFNTNPHNASDERRATSDERRATSDERRATSDERRATNIK